MKLKVLTEGDERLRVICKPVTKITPAIKKLIADMIETMYYKKGVGLAAPQVGSDLRIIVFDPRTTKRRKPQVLINPELSEMRGEIRGDEGCLSCPGLTGTVTRPAYVKIKGLDRNGNEVVYEGEGLTAKAFCHENDHLDGILYIDKATNVHPVGEDADEEEEDAE